MSRRRTIYNALPIVAATYAERFGVQVKIGGHLAHTDGETITIPSVPEDYPNMDVIWGYLAHEAAHVRYTDFSAGALRGLHGVLTNAIEDTRIELAMMQTYPGTVNTLHEVTRYMIQAGHYESVTSDDSPASAVAKYTLYWLIANVLQQPEMDPFVKQARVSLARMVPSGVLIRLHMLLHKAAQLTSTLEAFELASSIIKMLEEEKEKAEQQSKQHSPQDDQASGANPDQDDGHNADGVGQGDSNDESQQNGQKPSGGDDSDGDLHPSGQPSASNADDPTVPRYGAAQQDSTAAGDDASATMAPGDVAQALSSILCAGDDQFTDAKEALRAELGQTARSDAGASFSAIKQAQRIHDDEQYGAKAYKKAKAHSVRIRQQLLGLVQASQRKASSTERRGKTLDTARLTRIVHGDTRVFRKPSDKRFPNTAVHILVDMSGSMSSMTSDMSLSYAVAQEAAMTLALALEGISGVNPAVTYFGNNVTTPTFCAMKHGERVVNNAGRFALQPTGSTPMAEGIWYAAFELSKTREARKQLIVITDGDPNNRTNVKVVLDLCQASDIEVFGIGIATNAVNNLFEQSIVINDVADLKTTLFSLMKHSLARAA